MNYATMPMMPTSAAALFAAMSEGMGMRHSDLATYLNVPGDASEATRVVRRWATGVRPIPVPIYDAVKHLYDELNQRADELEAGVLAAQARGEQPILLTYRKLPDLIAAEPDLPYGSLEYHRAILLRVWESTGASLLYAEIPDAVA